MPKNPILNEHYTLFTIQFDKFSDPILNPVDISLKLDFPFNHHPKTDTLQSVNMTPIHHFEFTTIITTAHSIFIIYTHTYTIQHYRRWIIFHVRFHRKPVYVHTQTHTENIISLELNHTERTFCLFECVQALFCMLIFARNPFLFPTLLIAFILQSLV